MATTKIYDNNEWKELSGIGRPFTQEEKDKLSVLGTKTSASMTTATVLGNGFQPVLDINADEAGTYIITIRFEWYYSPALSSWRSDLVRITGIASNNAVTGLVAQTFHYPPNATSTQYCYLTSFASGYPKYGVQAALTTNNHVVGAYIDLLRIK